MWHAREMANTSVSMDVLEILGLAGGYINMYYRSIMGGCGLDSSGLGDG